MIMTGNHRHTAMAPEEVTAFQQRVYTHGMDTMYAAGEISFMVLRPQYYGTRARERMTQWAAAAAVDLSLQVARGMVTLNTAGKVSSPVAECVLCGCDVDEKGVITHRRKFTSVYVYKDTSAKNEHKVVVALDPSHASEW